MARGGLWIGAARLCRQMIQVVAYILLARTLLPGDYGTVGLTAVWLGFMEVFSDLGMGSAVIQRSDVDDADLQSAFWVALLTAALLIATSVGLAPLVSR